MAWSGMGVEWMWNDVGGMEWRRMAWNGHGMGVKLCRMAWNGVELRGMIWNGVGMCVEWHIPCLVRSMQFHSTPLHAISKVQRQRQIAPNASCL